MRIVLIVEDNSAYRTQMVGGLSRYHNEFEVLTAENGREATALLKTCAVDIVVTDLGMPVMDGFALLTHLRQDYPHTPAIVLTGMTQPEVLDRLSAYGDLQVLQKPASHDELINEIRSGLGKVSRGKARGITLPNLLQLLSLDRRSCSILVSQGERQGSLDFLSGDLVGAQVFDEALSGEQAAVELLGWQEAQVELQTQAPDIAPDDEQIQTPLDELLMQVYGDDSDDVATEADAAEPAPTEALFEDTEVGEPMIAENEQAVPDLPESPMSEAELFSSPAQSSPRKEMPMADIRQSLQAEAEALSETMRRLQARAQEANEALEKVMGDFDAFREKQRRYEQAESLYMERQERLEQLRSGAEQLAQQLLSVVKQVDEDPIAGKNEPVAESV